MVLGKHCSWREPCVVKRAAREYKSARDLRSMLLSERHLEEQRREFWVKRKIARAHNGVLTQQATVAVKIKGILAGKMRSFVSCANRPVVATSMRRPQEPMFRILRRPPCFN